MGRVVAVIELSLKILKQDDIPISKLSYQYLWNSISKFHNVANRDVIIGVWVENPPSSSCQKFLRFAG